MSSPSHWASHISKKNPHHRQVVRSANLWLIMNKLPLIRCLRLWLLHQAFFACAIFSPWRILYGTCSMSLFTHWWQLVTKSDHPPLWYSCLSSCSSWWRLFSTEVILLLSLVSERFSRYPWFRSAWSSCFSNCSTRASKPRSSSANLDSASIWTQKPQTLRLGFQTYSAARQFFFSPHTLYMTSPGHSLWSDFKALLVSIWAALQCIVQCQTVEGNKVYNMCFNLS